MAEIRAIPWNGLRVASTFSGGGGSSLGYRMAGFKVVWASEFVDAARATYAANFPETVVDGRDLRLVKPEEILAAAGLSAGELDVLDGSPPCASFSTAGKREKGWGQVKTYSDKEQRTDDLFFEFARILGGLQPRAFVAENVYGLVKGVAKGVFVNVFRALEACGYVVRAQLLDAQWLGVPQQRTRVIFVGVRRDLGVEPAHPRPLSYRYSLREALGFDATIEYENDNRYQRLKKKQATRGDDVSRAVAAVGINGRASHQARLRVVHDTGGTHEGASKGDVTDRPCPPITVGHGNATHYRVGGGKGAVFDQKGADVPLDEPSPTIVGGQGGRGSHQMYLESTPVPTLDGYAIGEEYKRLRPGEQSGKYFSMVRADEAKASPCVTATGGIRGAAGVVHPHESRKFTIAELKRICSFPDDFVLTGSYSQQWERCGRAVPPLMMYSIARTLRDEVFAKVDGRK